MWNHSMIPPPFPPFLFTLHEWWNTFPPPFCVEKEAKKFRKNKIIKFHTLVLPFSLFSLQLNCFHPQTRCPPSFFHSIFLKLSWVVFLSFRCFVTCIFPLTSMGSLTLIWNISARDLDGNIFFELYFWNFFIYLFFLVFSPPVCRFENEHGLKSYQLLSEPRKRWDLDIVSSIVHGSLRTLSTLYPVF